jgi:GYF domain 2
MEYFISEGTKTLGPFTKEELKQQKISGSRLVFTDETNWVEAKTIPDLADLFKRVPPPPPPPVQNQQGESKKQEPVYQAAAPKAATQTNTSTEKKGSNSWLYGVLIVLGLGGGGTVMYNQQQEKQHLQDEIQSRNMQEQEENARKERERQEMERAKKRQEIETAKQQIRSQIANLTTEYGVQRDNLSKASEWEFLRTAQERENQIRAINNNMRDIEEAIRLRNVQLNELEKMNI